LQARINALYGIDSVAPVECDNESDCSDSEETTALTRKQKNRRESSKKTRKSKSAISNIEARQRNWLSKTDDTEDVDPNDPARVEARESNDGEDGNDASLLGGVSPQHIPSGRGEGGKIYIGFPTHQTTGAMVHIFAPLVPTVERENIDFVDPTLRKWNEGLLRASGMLLRCVHEYICCDSSAEVLFPVVATSRGMHEKSEESLDSSQTSRQTISSPAEKKSNSAVAKTAWKRAGSRVATLQAWKTTTSRGKRRKECIANSLTTNAERAPCKPTILQAGMTTAHVRVKWNVSADSLTCRTRQKVRGKNKSLFGVGGDFEIRCRLQYRRKYSKSLSWKRLKQKIGSTYKDAPSLQIGATNSGNNDSPTPVETKDSESILFDIELSSLKPEKRYAFRAAIVLVSKTRGTAIQSDWSARSSYVYLMGDDRKGSLADKVAALLSSEVSAPRALAGRFEKTREGKNTNINPSPPLPPFHEEKGQRAQVPCLSRRERALVAMTSHAFVESHPAPQVANLIKMGFFGHLGYGPSLTSTQGIKPSSSSRLPWRGAEEHIRFCPIVTPETVRSCRNFFSMLTESRMIRELSLVDLFEELRDGGNRRALTVLAAVKLIRWWIDALPSHEVQKSWAARQNRSSQTPSAYLKKVLALRVSEDNIVLMKDKTHFWDPKFLSPSLPKPLSVASFDFTKHFSYHELRVHLGWFERFDILSWIMFVLDSKLPLWPSSNGRKHSLAEAILTALGKALKQRGLPSEKLPHVLRAISSCPCIPASVGNDPCVKLYLPGKTYLRSGKGSGGEVVPQKGIQTSSSIGVRQRKSAESLLEGLPFVAQSIQKSVDRRVLLQLGVNERPKFSLVISSIERLGWSNEEVIKYCYGLRSKLKDDERSILRSARFLRPERQLHGRERSESKTTPNRQRRARELFFPNKDNREMGLPLLQWPFAEEVGEKASGNVSVKESHRVSKLLPDTPLGQFLVSLGLQTRPSLKNLLGIASSNPLKARRDAALQFLAANMFTYYHEEYESLLDACRSVDSLDVSPLPALIPISGGKLAHPLNCFIDANAGLRAMRFHIVAPAYLKIAHTLGVRQMPSPHRLLQQLVNTPPTLEAAPHVFGYLSQMLIKLKEYDLGQLCTVPLVPVKPFVAMKPSFSSSEWRSFQTNGYIHLSPNKCFFSDERKKREKYNSDESERSEDEEYYDEKSSLKRTGLFNFVDFGPESESFLKEIGVGPEPNPQELALRVAKFPGKLLAAVGPEGYESILRKLAFSHRTISRRVKALLTKSPCLLAYSRKSLLDADTTCELKGGEAEGIGTKHDSWCLAKSSDISLIDDTVMLQLFVNEIVHCPLDPVLETFYENLGSGWLSAQVHKIDRPLGMPTPNKLSQQIRMLVIQRAKLWLMDSRGGLNEDAKLGCGTRIGSLQVYQV
jgi:hypothetical protein